MHFSVLFTGLALLASWASATVFSTGVSGPVQVRYEIRELEASYPRQFTLFLLAMQKWKASSITNATSFYPIAGIHGMPQVNYNDVDPCSTCRTSHNGYCTHSSILFMPWHRIYMATYEQEVVRVAKAIAKTFPASTRAEYVAAAAKLRLPYWDWAAHPPNGGNTLPIQFTAASVTLVTPTGSKTIPNPLLQYTLPDPEAMYYTPFTHWPKTLRYPSSNAADATSNESKDIAAFNNIRGSLQDRVYQMFSTCNTFEGIGLDPKVDGKTPKCSSSLELIHDTIHTVTGGPAQTNPNISGGHMTYLAVAAMDPIFFHHHAMVDRLFTLWQAVYPDSYGGTQNNLGTPTWTYAKGSDLDATSPLTPFKRTSGGFWNTNDVKDHTDLGYTYPEFVNSNGSPSAIKSYINALYGPSATATIGLNEKRTPAPEPTADPGLLPDISDTLADPLKAANGSLFQYVARITTPKYALGGSYFIYLFGGSPGTDDTSDYLLSPNLIAPLGVLSQAMKGMAVNSTGSISLTRYLTDAVSSGALPDLTEATVVPYLLKQLQLRIVGPEGTIVNPNTISGFDVSVYASSASPVSDSELPDWSDFILLEDVTKTLLGEASNIASAAASVLATAAPSPSPSTTTQGVTITPSTSASTPTASAHHKRRSLDGGVHVIYH